MHSKPWCVVNVLIRKLGDGSKTFVLQNTETKFRLSYFHIPSDLESVDSQNPASVSAVLHRLILRRALLLATHEDVLNILDRLSPSADSPKVGASEQAVLSEESHLHSLIDSQIETDVKAFRAYLKSTVLLGRSLGLRAGDAALIINGRVSLLCS